MRIAPLAPILVSCMFAAGLPRVASAQVASPAQRPMVAPRAPMDGADVVRLMHDRYVGRWYNSLTFTQITERRTPADTLGRETWYEQAKIPGRLRIDVGAPTGNPTILYLRDSVFLHRAGQPTVRHAGRNPLMLLGFDVYAQPVERTVSVLREEGFDLSKLREDTLEGRHVYVIGAAADDSVSKQFWVDADRMLFLRMLEPAGPGKGELDIRFDQYHPYGGGWVAVSVTVTNGGKLLQRETYSDVKINVPIPDSRFDPNTLDQP